MCASLPNSSDANWRSKMQPMDVKDMEQTRAAPSEENFQFISVVNVEVTI